MRVTDQPEVMISLENECNIRRSQEGKIFLQLRREKLKKLEAEKKLAAKIAQKVLQERLKHLDEERLRLARHPPPQHARLKLAADRTKYIDDLHSERKSATKINRQDLEERLKKLDEEQHKLARMPAPGNAILKLKEDRTKCNDEIEVARKSAIKELVEDRLKKLDEERLKLAKSPLPQQARSRLIANRSKYHKINTKLDDDFNAVQGT